LQGAEPSVHQALAQGDLEGAPLDERERGLLKFVRRVTLYAYKTNDDDVQRLRELGWTDPQIAESVYITALFAFFNRVADAFGLVDPNYFAAGPPRGGEPPERPDSSTPETTS
jgi:alkylhydroperoxidase family enzyme